MKENRIKGEMDPREALEQAICNGYALDASHTKKPGYIVEHMSGHAREALKRLSSKDVSQQRRGIMHETFTPRRRRTVRLGTI